METSHEYDMAMLTTENHGKAHEYLRQARIGRAVESIGWLLMHHHKDIGHMDAQRITIEVLSRWQRQLDNPDCDE